MTELRVPTVSLPAAVLCSDGQRLTGHVFVPAAASRHPGPTRPDEWLNETDAFFPFQADGAPRPVILNKRQVLSLSLSADPADAGRAGAPRERRVSIELGPHRFEGTVMIDMPENRSRVLDVLNRDEDFVTLHSGSEWHLIQKRSITRVSELA